jgi:hypothetical protein
VRRSTAWRTLISTSLTLSLTATVTSSSGHAATSPPRPSARLAHATLSLAEVQRLSKSADQRVIVILRDPYHGLPTQGTTRAARAAAIATTQRPILGELAQLHARGVRTLDGAEAEAREEARRRGCQQGHRLDAVGRSMSERPVHQNLAQATALAVRAHRDRPQQRGVAVPLQACAADDGAVTRQRLTH